MCVHLLKTNFVHISTAVIIVSDKEDISADKANFRDICLRLRDIFKYVICSLIYVKEAFDLFDKL